MVFISLLKPILTEICYTHWLGSNYCTVLDVQSICTVQLRRTKRTPFFISRPNFRMHFFHITA